MTGSSIAFQNIGKGICIRSRSSTRPQLHAGSAHFSLTSPVNARKLRGVSAEPNMPFSVSRRSLLRGAAVVSGAGLLRLAASGQNPNGRRALALIGDRYHNADYIRVALNKIFDGQGVTVDYTIDYTRLSRSLLSNYQLFLCLRDGMIWPNGYLGPDAYTSYEQGLENREDFSEAKPQTWLTEEQAVAIKEFVTAGNGFYSLHNNSHVSLSS